MAFSSPVYYSFSFQNSSLIPKFERTFEEIFKKKKDYKETLKIYNFRKPIRQAGPSEQVNPICISNFKEDHQRFATIAIITITSRGAYLGTIYKESSYSQQETHKKNKSVNNGYKSKWEKSVYSSR